MYRIYLLVISIFTLIYTRTNAQTIMSAGFSGTGNNIDVVHQTCYWRINPDSTIKYIKGFVQTDFKTIQNNVSSLSFDLNDVLNVDSILYHKQKLSSSNYTQGGNLLSITLPQTLLQGIKDSIIVYYQGTPPAPSGSASGYTLSTDQGTGLKYISTLSESYEDRDWWPCKADMQDKIDSMDIYVSVPWTGTDTFWVASNGVIKDSAINGISRLFHYKVSNPIASYLVGLSVARYNRYYRTPVTINGTKVPVAFYLLAGKPSNTYNTAVSAMDKATQLVSIYSQKYGDYPFKNEKHGYYEGLSGAEGMEHQTFSAIASFGISSVTTLAHELMHQWFGDKVSFATWNDLWLAEGFAVYGEILGAELLPTFGQTVVQKRTNVKQRAQQITDVGVWIPNYNIANSNLIWNSSYGAAVYDRGGMVVSMLRTICGDSLYFKTMKQYTGASSLAYKSANTDTLLKYFNNTLGADITPFFTDYVYGNGWPTYTVKYTMSSGNLMELSIVNQTTTTGAAASYFRGPVVVRVQGSTVAQDTLITFFDWGNGDMSYAGNGLSAPVSGNHLYYKLSFNPVTVTFDPYAQTLANGSMILNLKIVDFTLQKNNKSAVLKLTLDDNKNNAPIYFQRSINGKDFVESGLMQLDKYSTNFAYIYNDVAPFKGVNYYRAYFYTESGQIQYSKVLSVDFSLENNMVIYPNPVAGQLSINMNKNNLAANYTIAVNDAAGKTVLSVVRKATDIIENIDVHSLTKGVYLINVLDDNKKAISSATFIKE